VKSEEKGWVFVFGVLVGFVAGVVTSALRRPVSRRASHFSRRTIDHILQEGAEGQSLYEPRTGSYVPVRDRRSDFGNVPASKDEVEKFLNQRRRLRAAKIGVLDSLPPPGGFGAGVAIGNPLLHFRDYTAVYYYLVAPPTIGNQAQADLLYMTSSNSASKGCEALLSFFKNEQFNCVFRIWDWAHPDVDGGGKFVKGRIYADLTEYLVPYRFPLDSGDELDTSCIYVVNVTTRVNGDSFQNEVYLQNHLTGTRDLVWSYSFDWPDKDNAQPFWWGPIFETFPSPGSPQYRLTNPVGFDQALIVQDGSEYQLTDAESTLTLPSGNGLHEIYRSRGLNAGLVCG
jgi:hypothetical protein